MGTQALQVIESITYLLDCHAGGRGFESRPLRRLIPVRTDHMGNGYFRRHWKNRSVKGVGCELEVRALVVDEYQIVAHEGSDPGPLVNDEEVDGLLGERFPKARLCPVDAYISLDMIVPALF